jgi:hypothetical protein
MAQKVAFFLPVFIPSIELPWWRPSDVALVVADSFDFIHL